MVIFILDQLEEERELRIQEFNFKNIGKANLKNRCIKGERTNIKFHAIATRRFIQNTNLANYMDMWNDSN